MFQNKKRKEKKKDKSEWTLKKNVYKICRFVKNESWERNSDKLANTGMDIFFKKEYF